MGTDIHLQVEVLGEDGVWKISPRKPFRTYDDEGFSWDEDPSGRNYNLFAFLANVRNGFGFAGFSTGARVEPQFPGRDFPEGYVDPKNLFVYENEWDDDDDDDETSPKLLTDSENEATSIALPVKRPRSEYTGGDFWIGDHSITHATLEELRGCDWDVGFTSTGYVELAGYLTFKQKGIPDGWSGGIYGQDIITFEDPKAYEKHILNVAKQEGFEKVDDINSLVSLSKIPDVSNAYVRIFWNWRPLSDCAFRRWIFGEVMQGLADEFGGPQNVRVIMGFDS